MAKEIPFVAIIFTLIFDYRVAMGKPTWEHIGSGMQGLSFLILLFIYLGLIFIDKAFKYNVNGDYPFLFIYNWSYKYTHYKIFS